MSDESPSFQQTLFLAHYHTLQSRHVALLGRNFEVSVDDPRKSVSITVDFLVSAQHSRHS